MGHIIKLGEKIQAQVNSHAVRQLDKENKDPHGSHTHETHGVTRMSKGHATTCSKLSYAGCIYNQLTALMMEQTEDNCTAPWFPGPWMNNSKICTKDKDINTTFWIYWNRVTNRMEDCNRPCNQLVLNIGGKNTEKTTNNTISNFYLYFASNSQQSQEHDLYPFLSMMAEIGGYLGLLLGYSCLDLASYISNLIGRQQRSLF